MSQFSFKVRLISGFLATTFLVFGGYILITRPMKSAPVASYNLRAVTMDENTYPAVVLGGGVGGLTAGIYLSMANIKTLLAQGSVPGGLLTQSHSVRNWPGEIDVPGSVITDKVRAQAMKRGVLVKDEKAVAVNVSSWPFTITLEEVTDPSKKRTVKALSLIVAMGALSNYLTVSGEKEYWSKGVTNCAVCEGSLYRDKEVCIVGGGDSAIEEASYLSSIAKHVTIYVRRDVLRAVDNRKDEVVALKNVDVVYNTSLTAIKGDGNKVTSISLINNKTKKEQDVPMDGVFLAIGFTPNTKMFEGGLALTKGGYIKCEHDQEASVPGVYAVGDIVDPVYKQAVTAAGDGCRAALQAQRFLADLGHHADVAPQATTQATKPATEEVAAKKIEEKKDDVAAPVVKASSLPTAGEVHEIRSVEEYEALMAQTERPVVVDFYATWCGPCKLMAPMYHRLAEKHKDVLFLKVNIDPLPGIAQKSNIYGVPTFVFVKEGKEVERVVGGGMREAQFSGKVEALKG